MATSQKMVTEASRQEEMNSLSSLLRTFLPDHQDLPLTDNAHELLQRVESQPEHRISLPYKSRTPFFPESNGQTSNHVKMIRDREIKELVKDPTYFPDAREESDDSDATVDLDSSDLEKISSKVRTSGSRTNNKIIDAKTLLEISKKYVCFVCDSGFRSLVDYKNHMVGLCGNNSWQHRCVDCGNSFQSRSAMHLHEKLAPYELWVDKEMQKKPLYQSEDSSNAPENPPDDKDFLCNHCGKPLKNFRVFLDHVYNHAVPKSFRCALCPDSFEAPCMLRFHIDNQHSQILPFQCHRCLRRFKLKCSLSTHIKYCKMDVNSLKYAEELQFIDHLNQQRKFQGLDDEKGTIQFSCPVCTFMFDSPEELQSHLMKHDESRPYQCDICGQGVTTKLSLQKHMQLHDTKQDFRCEICGVELVSRSGYKAHLRGHRNIEQLQVQAGLSTASKSTEDIVNKIYAGIEIKSEILSDDEKASTIFLPYTPKKVPPKKKAKPTYHCPMCDALFHTGGAKFQAHVRKEHPDAELEECSICKKKFHGNNNLLKHKDIHQLYSQTFTCEECGRVFRRKYALEVHKRIHSFKKFVKCDICDQEFRFVSEVEKHKHAKHKYDKALNIFKCNVCGQKFPVLSHLSVHCYYHNIPDAKAFECDLCKVSFKTATELKQHIYKKHDNLMKAISDTEKALKGKAALSGAMAALDGVVTKMEPMDTEENVSKKVSKSPNNDSKSLKSLGEMSAAAANNLSCSTAIFEGTDGKSTVMRLIPNSDDDGEMTCKTPPKTGVEAYNFATRQSMLQSRYLKRFSCDVCTKTFSTKSDLKTHLRTHSGETPFKCEYCDRSFKQRGHRKLHIQVAHTKEMPYKCTECDSAFPTRYRFQIHLKRHNGVKEFKCAYCPKEFYTKGKMNEHKKLRHKEEWEDEQQQALANSFSGTV